ncbi:Uncharacterised protein [Bordetella pertussis]|nr:Uncharacterised protein [Bordetella pertussis]
MKPEITTRPSGTSTRSTSRSTRWGASAHSKACGSTSRSTLCDSNGSASGAAATQACQPCASSGGGTPAPTQALNGMRLARSRLGSASPTCQA